MGTFQEVKDIYFLMPICTRLLNKILLNDVTRLMNL